MSSPELANVVLPYPTVISLTAHMVFNVVWIDISFPERNIYKALSGQEQWKSGRCL